MKNREILIEMTPVGQIVRVTAMDTKSLTEVIISCPATTPKQIMEKNAVKRLEFVLKKKGIIS